MTRPIRWRGLAVEDLEQIHATISDDHPGAARKLAAAILDGVELLREQPHIGRPGRVPGTRELVLSPYIVAYTLLDDVVVILRVLHAARRWPSSF